jgi:hypothetical protein
MAKTAPIVTTPLEEGKKFWQGADFYVALGLIIASASSAFMDQTQAQLTWLVEGIFAGVYLLRQLATGKFSFKSFEFNNGWSYIGQILILVAPQFAETVPVFKELVKAFVDQNWPAVISGLLSLGTILYYILTRGNNKKEAKRILSAE